MFVLDICIIALFVLALYSGFKEGIIVQLAGLAAIFLGVYLAFRFGNAVGHWLGGESELAGLTGFAVVLFIVLIVVAILGRLVKGLMKITGLGLFDRLGGMLLSALKMGLGLAIVFYCFDRLNSDETWVEHDKLGESKLYAPLVKAAGFAFPYVDKFREGLMPAPDPMEEVPVMMEDGHVVVNENDADGSDV